jgi:hypothetical protein
MFLVGVAYRMTYESWQFSQETMHDAWGREELGHVRCQWRAFVHGCTAAAWTADGRRFQAGTASAEVRDGLLLLCRGGKTREVALPARMTAAVTVETEIGSATAAVLTLKWTSRFFGRSSPQGVRIVACAGRSTAP